MKKNYGFTLVEMSIVLVIIAIIALFIIGGSYLVTQYQLRAIINEQNYYKTAINGFLYQYGQLPGDFNAASTIWPNCYTTPANCNGNNNGVIYLDNTMQYTDESLRAWQHLYLAGYIEQKLSGYHNTANQNNVGINVPASKFSGAGWYIDSVFAGESTSVTNINTLIIGGNVSGSFNNALFLTPLQAQNIDQKIDDGKPFTGKVRGIFNDGVALNYTTTPVGTTCALSSMLGYNTGSAYINRKICSIAFRIGFN